MTLSLEFDVIVHQLTVGLFEIQSSIGSVKKLQPTISSDPMVVTQRGHLTVHNVARPFKMPGPLV